MAKLTDILGQEFDSGAVDPQQSFDVLPAGMYSLEITDAEVKDTKAGNGKLMKITHDVIDPEEFAGRKVWANITLRNPNAQAEQIGAQQLSGLCRAAGIGVLQDSDELIGKIVRAKIGIKPASGQYAEQNVVKAYETANAAPAAKPAAPAKPAAAKTAPWQKKTA